MHRMGLLSALLLTAALLCAMPGLLRSFGDADENRMERQLRPAESRTLTLWLLGDSLGDDGLIRSLCAAFEKERPGVRVFLRGADVSELYSPGTVPPDGVLYATGNVAAPEKIFLPIAAPEALPDDALSSGKSGGTQYALPLWYAVNVLSLPADWLGGHADEPSDSFFGLTPPTDSTQTALSWETVPWRRLLEPGALCAKKGVCLSQLLFVCPNALRGELTAALDPGKAPAKGTARAWSLREHEAAVRAGEKLTALPLLPPAAGATRYLSLMTDNADVRALLAFFTGRDAGCAAQAASFLAALPGCVLSNALLSAAGRTFADGALIPNAFAHAPAELNALCLDGFLRNVDPVETLLRLR